MKENNFNFTNGVSYDVWYEQKRLIDQLKKENEELKKFADANTNSTLRLRNEIRDLQAVSVKRKDALEEIEKELKEDVYCESQECGCDDFEECLNCVKTQILDIINKAKGEGNE